LIKNDNFLLIQGQKHDFLRRPLKRVILTLFLGFFWPDFTQEKIKKLHNIPTKLDKGFRLVYELNYMDEKKISPFF
jgi:hypothetical protein